MEKMLNFVVLCLVVAVMNVKSEESVLPERKNVLDLSRSRKVGRNLLGKSSSSKWDTDTDTTDDGVCGCSAYLDDSSSSDSWSSGKKTSSSSSGKKTSTSTSGSSSSKWTTDTTSSSSGKSRRRRRRLGKSSSNSKWSTDATSTSTTAKPFDSFCDCLCDCDGGNSVTYNHAPGSKSSSSSSSSRWSSNDCGGSSSSGKKSSSSGKSRRRLGKSSSNKWSTDDTSTTSGPCSTATETEEPFSTTTISCQCGTTTTEEAIPTTTDEPSEDPTDSPTEKPTTSPSDKPTDSPSDRPTNSPSDRPSDSPTDKPSTSPTERPTNSPSDKPSDSPTDRPTDSPTTKTCDEDTNYIILGLYWEMYLPITDESLLFSGRYNQDGEQFNHITEPYSIWFEEVGTDYVLFIGDQSEWTKQLQYKDFVSTWTDLDNPLTDSDNEAEWEKQEESAEYVTANMTIYDCEGNNLGTDVVSLYDAEYAVDVSGCVQTQIDILKVVLIASVIGIIFG